MGQYRSYRDAFLDKQVASLERELLAYKTIQKYDSQQIQPRLITTQTIQSQYGTPISTDVGYTILGTVTFTGVNKKKIARGGLDWKIVAMDDWSLQDSIIGGVSFAASGQSPNVLKWNVFVFCYRFVDPFSSYSGPTTTNFSAVFQVHANMGGALVYEPI